MKFGVREICDVVFKAKASGNLGQYHYEVGQPVLYIDSAKTSTIEGAATTVYATGGRGNARLIAWEGEKTLTFTVEDALLSPMGFAILSGAGLLDPAEQQNTYVHATAQAILSLNTKTESGSETSQWEINLNDALESGEEISTDRPVFVMMTDSDGSLTGQMLYGFTVSSSDKKALVAAEGDVKLKVNKYGDEDDKDKTLDLASYSVFVDFYIEKPTKNVHELTIDAGNFAGNYYVEASTLFRRQSDGHDLPAEIVFPNVKIQSNFTFNMAATGDPSTFTFTMDALPGKLLNGGDGKNVLCVIQIVEDVEMVGEFDTTKDSLAD